MFGLLNIDKPDGLTSHDVVARVRRLAGMRRVGHSGTLDPAATGVLVVCLGKATRLVEYLVGRKKIYRGTVTLGQETTTYDAEGEIVSEKPVPELTREMIDTALESFRGDILQVPPMVSAIKKDGQPLYKLAREGKVVERKARPVTVYNLVIIDVRLPDIDLEIECSAGTYIRSIAHDLGAALGCVGHLSHLRRTAVGEFSVERAVQLADLTPENIQTHLLPLDRAVNHLPRVNLNDQQTIDLCNGKLIEREEVEVEGDLLRVYDPDGEFVGLVTPYKRFWKAKKILKAQPH